MSQAIIESPYDIYGPLLAAVQMSGIFGDGKAFVDATPKHPVDTIMADFADLKDPTEATLLAFVHANFDVPVIEAHAWAGDPEQSLSAHIRATWRHLVREPIVQMDGCSALPIDHRHVVPGGRFRELYYWDSFFTMLGLVRDGETELAVGMVDIMTELIERHGHVPNGTRTYYVGRSQPPLYHMMVDLISQTRPDHSARRLAAMKAEHAWWMAGERDVAAGESCQRVLRLADGSVLNRYWDPRATPRDESWREDVETANASVRPCEEIFRDLRAAAESGWDFSSRWLDDHRLSSIRTTTIAPIDLNAFLYSLELAIAARGGDGAEVYAARAEQRLRAIQSHCWSAKWGCFVDLDFEASSLRHPTAAALAPLLCRTATTEQADATAAFVKTHLIAPGGLRTTLTESGQQWDMPNGWAPLQWIAVQGLLNYGHRDLAMNIAQRWIATVSDTFLATGFTHEKYDVERGSVGAGGEYEPQIGFGWTNGVTRDFLDRLPH